MSEEALSIILYFRREELLSVPMHRRRRRRRRLRPIKRETMKVNEAGEPWEVPSQGSSLITIYDWLRTTLGRIRPDTHIKPTWRFTKYNTRKRKEASATDSVGEW